MFLQIAIENFQSLIIRKKCYERLNFKLLRSRVYLTITINPQMIFNNVYYLKIISRRYLKISLII